MDNSILEKIHQATLKLLYPVSMEETCALIGKEAMKMVGGDECTIMLYHQKEFKRIYTSNQLLHQSQPRKIGNTYNVFKNKKPMITNMEQLRAAPVHPIAQKIGIKSSMMVPLTNRNRSWGVLSVMSRKENNFTQKDLDILQLFGTMAALAIRKAQLYSETKDALDSRDLFISMAAHELRTPLTTINGYVQLLHSKLSGGSNSESRWIEELSWETLRLTQLINELLEVERIKQGELRYVWKECHLKDIVKRVISDFKFNYPDHKITLVDQIKNGNDIVVGDFDKLMQAVINLLDNAAKFSPTGSEVTVTLKSKLPDITISIKDSGSGIAKKDLPEVFEKFYRADTHNREGMGIGLFLVKNIIKQHKGNIDIHSKEGRGTRVEIKLPQTKHG